MKLARINAFMEPKVKRVGSSSYQVQLLGTQVADFASRSEANICRKDLRRLLRRCVSGQTWYFGHMISAIGSWAGYANIGSPYAVGVTSTIEG
jgi:hypothetical protein